MYGAVDNEVFRPPSPTVVVTTPEYKVYRRRWLYLVCICLANMSNAIVRFLKTNPFCSCLKSVYALFSYGLILLRSPILQKIILMFLIQL
jgi:hypothetical protein